jgi:hypothetical protein
MQEGVSGADRLADRESVVVVPSGGLQVNTRQVDLASRQQPETGQTARWEDQQPESGPVTKEIGEQGCGGVAPGQNQATGGNIVPLFRGSA